MDPCRDVRHKLVTALLERKTRILREAEEGGKLLQEEARRASAGAAQEAAFAKWNLFRREVLFPAHAQAQKIDLQVCEIVQAPCNEILRQARELGIREHVAEPEEAETRPLPAPPLPARERKNVEPTVRLAHERWREEIATTPAGDETGAFLSEPAGEQPGADAAGYVRREDGEVSADIPLPVPDPAERTTPPRSEGMEEPDGATTESPGPLSIVAEEQIPPDVSSLTEADGIAGDKPLLPLSDLPDEPTDPDAHRSALLDEPAEEVDAQEPAVIEDQAVIEPETPGPEHEPAKAMPLPVPVPMNEQGEAAMPAPEAVQRTADLVPVGPPHLPGPQGEPETQRLPTPEASVPQVTVPLDLVEEEIEAVPDEQGPPLAVTAEPAALGADLPEAKLPPAFGFTERRKAEEDPVALEAMEQPSPAGKRRLGAGLPMWLVALLSGLAGVVATAVVVVLLLNSRFAWRASEVPAAPAPPTATSAATAETLLPPTAAAVAIATHTPTSLPSPTSTPVPSPTKQPSPTPVPQPTSTRSPSPTPSPRPSATRTPSPTMVPTSTSTSTPRPTATPSTPQVLVDGTYNVRSGPGTNYPLAGQVQAGQTLEILGQNDAGTWWQVCCVQGESAWILASLAPSEGPVESVAVIADIPPAPEVEIGVEEVPESLSGRIAFPVFDQETQTYDLYMANPDGSDLHWLLDEASQPTFRPDGQRIAFRRWWGGGRGIAVIDLAGGELQVYTQGHEDALPSWGLDGRSLVFSSRRESDRRSRIYSVDLLLRSVSVITHNTLAVYGEVANQMADGSIVYKVTWPEAGLAVMNTAGAGERLIVADGSVAAPAGSPDGSAIAYMSYQDGNWEIYRVNVDGSGVQRLTDSPANDGLPAWSPDGRTIAFVSDQDGSWAMWAMTAGGQGHTQLFALP
ncbi:MAG TPA: SH3 domain-containing protein, partial [Anaerolineae bacterium]|nr:SH3 domain-containing protein [Anaerolineae bacterium]